MAVYGARVSQPGKDVRIAFPYELLLDERFPLFKVFAEGEDSIVLPAGNFVASKTVTHNLGYKSAVFIFGELATGSGERFLINGRNPFLRVGVDEVFMFVKITNNTLVIDIEALSSFGTNHTYDFHYYVTYDELGI